MNLDFVNIHGQPITRFDAAPAKPKKRPERESYHNGWRVVGIPPGALENGRKAHAAAQTLAKAPKEWDEANWLMNAKRAPVRSKPYEIPQAAEDCKALAERAGWLRVEIVEIKKEAPAKSQELPSLTA